jgi:hypothetical protein
MNLFEIDDVKFQLPTASNGLMQRQPWCVRFWHGSWPIASRWGNLTSRERSPLPERFCSIAPNRFWEWFRVRLTKRS